MRSTTTKTAADYFAAGQLVLAACLFISTLLLPQYFFSLDQGGVSNFGTQGRTVIWFVAGFAAAAGGAFAAARTITGGGQHRQLRIDLYALAALYLFVMISTFWYKQAEDYRQLHEQASILLFVYMAIMATSLRLSASGDQRTKRLFLVFVCGIILGLATLIGPLTVLFTAQLVAGGAFGGLVYRSLSRHNNTTVKT